MSDNGVSSAWIGLQKQADTCNTGINDADYDCRRNGWSWQDGVEYTYPSWHVWSLNEPDRNELCVVLDITSSSWWGRTYYDRNPYLCAKGKIK